jgi:hypothetical protein
VLLTKGDKRLSQLRDELSSEDSFNLYAGTVLSLQRSSFSA